MGPMNHPNGQAQQPARPATLSEATAYALIAAGSFLNTITPIIGILAAEWMSAESAPAASASIAADTSAMPPNPQKDRLKRTWNDVLDRAMRARTESRS